MRRFSVKTLALRLSVTLLIALALLLALAAGL